MSALNGALRVSMPDFRQGRARRAPRARTARRCDRTCERSRSMMRNVPASVAALPRRRRIGLQQAARDVPRLGQEEQADLRDVRPGRDVDEVVLGLGVERVGAGEVVQRAIHLLEVPRVRRVIGARAAPRSRATRGGCRRGRSRPAREPLRMEQLEAVDKQVFVLTRGNGRTPRVPIAPGRGPGPASCRAAQTPQFSLSA